MPDQLTTNPEALRLFFTEDIFLVKERETIPSALETKSDIAPANMPGTDREKPVITGPDPVSTENENSNEQPVAPVTFKYEGANQRDILILVNDANNPVGTKIGRELLGNILKSIKLERNDCALVNYASCNDARFSELQSFFKPQYVFAFGLSPYQLGLPDIEYNSIVSQDGTKLIFSSNLDDLNDDPATKKLLWASLQQIKL